MKKSSMSRSPNIGRFEDIGEHGAHNAQQNGKWIIDDPPDEATEQRWLPMEKCRWQNADLN